MGKKWVIGLAVLVVAVFVLSFANQTITGQAARNQDNGFVSIYPDGESIFGDDFEEFEKGVKKDGSDRRTSFWRTYDPRSCGVYKDTIRWIFRNDDWGGSQTKEVVLDGGIYSRSCSGGECCLDFDACCGKTCCGDGNVCASQVESKCCPIGKRCCKQKVFGTKKCVKYEKGCGWGYKECASGD